MTPRDIIRVALRTIGVLATGENPSADEQQDAFYNLNRLIQQWSIQKLFIYSVTEEVFQFNPNQQLYTMGPGGNFNTTRPNKISEMNVRINGGTTSQLDIPMHILDNHQWAKIGVKLTQSSWPTHVYPDYQYPLINLNFWPIPQQAQGVEIFSYKSLTGFVTVNDTVILPPGYEDALIYNLAIRLCPEYGKASSEELQGLATASKMHIKIENDKQNLLRTDPAVQGKSGSFNWYTGEPQ
jgi:hypothetical protein